MQKYQRLYARIVCIVSSCLLLFVSVIGASAQTNNTNFKEYVPYLHESYSQYLGDGTLYYQKDYLLEFKPDSRGVFQVASYNQANETVAYVYQIREDGLYELARFTPYTTVTDLRYSAEATDSEESLILPSKLDLNVSYQSGYDSSVQRTIVSQGVECNIDEASYGNVIKIKQVQGDVVTYHYYAPHYGLVLVTNENGSPIEILSTP